MTPWWWWLLAAGWVLAAVLGAVLCGPRLNDRGDPAARQARANDKKIRLAGMGYKVGVISVPVPPPIPVQTTMQTTIPSAPPRGNPPPRPCVCAARPGQGHTLICGYRTPPHPEETHP